MRAPQGNRKLRIWEGEFWEGEAPAEPLSWQRQRLGRSLALPIAQECDCTVRAPAAAAGKSCKLCCAGYNALMSVPAERPRHTVAEYLQQEHSSFERHEFVDGETLLMAGGTANHSLIVANVIAAVHGRLKDKPCRRSEEHTSELQSQFHLVC